MPNAVDLYDNVYGDFDSRAETDVRARAFGEDIGAERRLSRYAYLAEKAA
jgi:hypothetical protein